MQHLKEKHDIRPIFSNPELADEEYLLDIAWPKRLLERLTSDPKFREELFEAPQETADKYDLRVDAEELRPLWDTDFALAMTADDTVSRRVARYRAWTAEKFAHRERIRQEGANVTRHYEQWRKRHTNRTIGELGAIKADSLVHATCCFELAKGCSVGCWFCGVAAPKLGDKFEATPENRALWQDSLKVVREVVGIGARRGFCYWASDPLDNLDYEDFCCDFHDILGKFPQTTTAIPMRDAERTRRVLKISTERGCDLNRFSVLTLKTFERIFEEFTPEELVYVELVPQNKEAQARKALAGRALLKLLKNPEKRGKMGFDLPPEIENPDSYNGTIACVSGFLFNMVERSVKLITPCNANERWPLGYRIYQEGTFDGPDELANLLKSMISSMKTSLSAKDKPTLRYDLTLDVLDNGFLLKSPFVVKAFTDERYKAMRALGLALQEQKQTVGEIALDFEAKWDISMAETFYQLNRLFMAGLLDDEHTLA